MSRMTESAATPPVHRWGQLVVGIICMIMIANLQYGWTLFVNPIDGKYHWGRAAIQVGQMPKVTLRELPAARRRYPEPAESRTRAA